MSSRQSQQQPRSSSCGPDQSGPAGTCFGFEDIVIGDAGGAYALFVDPDQPSDNPPQVRLDHMERVRHTLIDIMRTQPTVAGALEAVESRMRLGKEWLKAADMTLESFLGSNKFETHLPKCATRLAGNHEDIARGMAIPRWTGDKPVWAVLRIATAVAMENGKTDVRMNSVWGPSAGMDFTYRMGHGAVSNMMVAMGLPKTRLPHRLWLTGMWAMAVVDAGPKGVRLDRVGATSGLARRNKELMDKRNGCSRTLRGISCETCPEGLDTCAAAVRPRRLALVKCSGCGMERAMEPGRNKCNKCRRGE